MSCEKFDLLLMGLVVVLLVALVTVYLVVVPVTIVMYGLAAQCAFEDPFGKFAAFTAAMLMSAFIGFNIANLTSSCEEDRNG
jgi:hypothetical protein